MKNKIMLDLLSYWEHLREGRLVPARMDIDPRAIKQCLPSTFILERSPKGITRFRLAGESLCDLLGMELRSMPAQSLITPDFRTQFEDALTTVMDKTQIQELHLSGEAYGHGRIKAEMLLMPMLGRTQEITRVLGCLVLSAPLIRPPVRFDIDDVKVTRIVAGKSAEADVMIEGMAEAGAPFDHQPAPEKSIKPADARAALRAVVGGGGKTEKPHANGARSHLKIIK